MRKIKNNTEEKASVFVTPEWFYQESKQWKGKPSMYLFLFLGKSLWIPD